MRPARFPSRNLSGMLTALREKSIAEYPRAEVGILEKVGRESCFLLELLKLSDATSFAQEGFRRGEHGAAHGKGSAVLSLGYGL